MICSSPSAARQVPSVRGCADWHAVCSSTNAGAECLRPDGQGWTKHLHDEHPRACYYCKHEKCESTTTLLPASFVIPCLPVLVHQCNPSSVKGGACRRQARPHQHRHRPVQQQLGELWRQQRLLWAPRSPCSLSQNPSSCTAPTSCHCWCVLGILLEKQPSQRVCIQYNVQMCHSNVCDIS